VTVIGKKERYMLCGLQGTAKDRRVNQSHLMELQKIKIAQPTKSDNDDGIDGDDTGGGTASLAAQEIAHEEPLSPFTADQFTHCIQD
jgi:hypothetical protein